MRSAHAIPMPGNRATVNPIIIPSTDNVTNTYRTIYNHPPQAVQQQPILLNGGTLSPLNVYHNPIWINSQDEVQAPQQPVPQPEMTKLKVNNINRQYTEEKVQVSPLVRQRVRVGGNPNQPYNTNGKVVQRFQKKLTNLNGNNTPKFMSVGDKIEYQEQNQYTNQDQYQNQYQNQNTNQYTNQYQNSNPEGMVNNIEEYIQNNNGMKISGITNHFLKHELDFVGDHQTPPMCVRREGKYTYII